MGVSYPFGKLDSVALSATGAQAITVSEQYTVIDGVTTAATGNRTLNLTIGDGVVSGARIFLKNKTAGLETTTFGTGFTCPVNTGATGKTFCAEFVYDGTTFKPVGAPYQID